MPKQHKHELIKSPFPVVNEYESEFVREWNDNTAKAVADLLKYLATATAVAIKDSPEDFIEENIEKGRPKKNWTIGDTFTRHGITYRCTGISPNTGRPMWSRVDKKGSKKAIDIWQVDPTIDKFTTAKECQDYVMKLGYMSYSSDITSVDLKSAKFICSAMVHLHDKIPYERIKVCTKSLKSCTMQACNGEWIEVNSKYFTNFDPDKYYKRTNEEYVEGIKKSLNIVEDTIKKMLEYNPNIDVSKLQKSAKKLKDKLNKCPRWTYGEKESLAADIFLHEMGHILQAQCTGGCGHWKTMQYMCTHTQEERDLHLDLNVEFEGLFKKYKKEQKVISEYSTTKVVECFAECFVAWLHNDKSLPQYMLDYFDKYFKQTTPRR